jgi:hypothetical protein
MTGGVGALGTLAGELPSQLIIARFTDQTAWSNVKGRVWPGSISLLSVENTLKVAVDSFKEVAPPPSCQEKAEHTDKIFGSSAVFSEDPQLSVPPSRMV